jgi:hypothetical protein
MIRFSTTYSVIENVDGIGGNDENIFRLLAQLNW